MSLHFTSQTGPWKLGNCPWCPHLDIWRLSKRAIQWQKPHRCRLQHLDKNDKVSSLQPHSAGILKHSQLMPTSIFLGGEKLTNLHQPSLSSSPSHTQIQQPRLFERPLALASRNDDSWGVSPSSSLFQRGKHWKSTQKIVNDGTTKTQRYLSEAIAIGIRPRLGCSDGLYHGECETHCLHHDFFVRLDRSLLLSLQTRTTLGAPQSWRTPSRGTCPPKSRSRTHIVATCIRGVPNPSEA